MKIFSYFYHKTIHWSSHHHAPYYLAGVSFIESFFFPIPPDVMLLSMGLAKPHHSWRYALIATIFSVIGGLFGYCLGFYLMEFIEPYLLNSAYRGAYFSIRSFFMNAGTFTVMLAGFVPFPYKIFTVTAGAMQLQLIPFVIGSFLGRGARFFLVSTLMYFFGAKIEPQLRRYIDWVGIALLVIVVCLYAYFNWFKSA
jgi:membrane protein YqaA with SNARE-associated domain